MIISINYTKVNMNHVSTWRIEHEKRNGVSIKRIVFYLYSEKLIFEFTPVSDEDGSLFSSTINNLAVWEQVCNNPILQMNP